MIRARLKGGYRNEHPRPQAAGGARAGIGWAEVKSCKTCRYSYKLAEDDPREFYHEQFYCHVLDKQTDEDVICYGADLEDPEVEQDAVIDLGYMLDCGRYDPKEEADKLDPDPSVSPPKSRLVTEGYDPDAMKRGNK